MASGRVCIRGVAVLVVIKEEHRAFLVYNCKAVVIQEDRRRVFDVSVVG